MEGTSWEPASILLMDKADFTYSLLVLNQPIDPSFYSYLREAAVDVVCADGGANRVFDTDPSESPEARAPSFICGDMDSIRPEVKEAFANLGTRFIEDRDLYATDFMKSLRLINSEFKLSHPWSHQNHVDSSRAYTKQQRKNTTTGRTRLDVIVLGGLGGRADQAFSQLHHLYAASIDPTLDRIEHIYLVTEESIIFLLEKGINHIETPVEVGQLAESVGIIPLGAPSIITTQGLEWDVTNWETSFGSQVSTSNHIRAPYVKVTTSERVLFTVHMAGGEKLPK